MSSQEPPKKKSKQVENKQGTLLSWVKPCTSDTEPGVVEETIRPNQRTTRKWKWFGAIKVNTNGKLETRTKGIVDKCSDLTTCTKKYALTEGPKRGGGGAVWVNVGHSLGPPGNFMLATGLFVTKYWCNSSFRSSYLCGLSKVKKSYVDAKEEPTYLYDNVSESWSCWMNLYMTHENKLRGHFGALPGSPLTHFRLVFDVSVENSWNKRNVWKGIPIFLVGKF